MIKQPRTEQTARTLATDLLYGLTDKWGDPYIDRVDGVVENILDIDVEPSNELLMAAWLHPALDAEGIGATAAGLRNSGYPEAVVLAIETLRRSMGESYLDMVRRISHNPIASAIELASVRYDLERLSRRRASEDVEPAVLKDRWEAAEKILTGGPDERSNPNDGPSTDGEHTKWLIKRADVEDAGLEEQFPAASQLLVNLMTRNATDAAFASNAIADTLTSNNNFLEGTLAAVRGEIIKLLDGPYAPNPERIREALYPPDHVRLRYRSEPEIED